MNVLYILAVSLICITGSLGIGYKEDYFDQRKDHFNFISYGNQTFKQRFIYNDTYWDRERGPIFFYAGNEGDIVAFWQNTGFIHSIAPNFRALVLFAEHRYYGKSLPFGNDSFEVPFIGLLSINQAVADYAFFIKGFKKSFKAEKNPVITFGGSYGGQLAVYMRIKFPNIILGSIAASAPIFQVAGKISGNVFFEAVTKDFRNISPQCESQVRSAFAQLQKWTSMGQAGLSEISKTFHLCSPLTSNKDYGHLLRWIRNAFVSAAMMDYPYPSSAIASLPAFPVKVMCNRLMSAARPADGLFSASAVYYNASATSTCFDIYKEYLYCADPTGCGLGSDSKAWDYQVCTEINLEGDTTGVKDMFPPLPFNSSIRDDYCLKTWKVLPRRNWLDVLYWGEDISSASNIVFSNGNLDPWASGGVLRNISDTLVAFLIDGGAHHLDLRADNPNDPPSVREARRFEVRNIQMWLQNYSY